MQYESIDPALPLAGIRVIDFTQVFLGPAATQVLGDYGADVIKIEPIGKGDLSRGFVDECADPQNNPVYLSANRNKRSIAIDLKAEEARDIVLQMVRGADVVSSNFRPHVMQRFGFDYPALAKINPRLIYARASGYGATGPYERKGGQDAIAQAMSGFMERRADPSIPASINPTSVCDYSAGMHLVQGILLALIARERTGRGQMVDASLYDSMLHLQMIEAACMMTENFEINWAARPLTGTFATSDGALVIVGGFRKNAMHHLCLALGIEDMTAEFPTRRLQGESRALIHQRFRERFRTNATAYWIRRLEEQDILCAPVRSLREALEDEQTGVNNMVWSAECADGRRLKTVGSPFHLSAAQASLRRFPPKLGEQTDEILREFGVTATRIAAMREKGIIA